MPRFDQFEALAVAGRREQHLREAGLRRIESEQFRWTYDLPDIGTIWDSVSGPGLFEKMFAGLDETQREGARQHLTVLLAPYRSAEGAYSLPHTCRLFWGSR